MDPTFTTPPDGPHSNIQRLMNILSRTHPHIYQQLQQRTQGRESEGEKAVVGEEGGEEEQRRKEEQLSRSEALNKGNKRREGDGDGDNGETASSASSPHGGGRLNDDHLGSHQKSSIQGETMGNETISRSFTTAAIGERQQASPAGPWQQQSPTSAAPPLSLASDVNRNQISDDSSTSASTTTLWTKDEKLRFNEALQEFSGFTATKSEFNSLTKYAKIAQCIETKTIREVAIHYAKMMARRSAVSVGQKRLVSQVLTQEEIQRNSPQQKQSVQMPPWQGQPLPSEQQSQQNSYSGTAEGVGHFGSGGLTDHQNIRSEEDIFELLGENQRIIEEIQNNIALCNASENIPLMKMFRENIIRVLTCMSKMSGIMSKMPAIPVKLNSIMTIL